MAKILPFAWNGLTVDVGSAPRGAVDRDSRLAEWQNTLAWLVRKNEVVEDLLSETYRSEQIANQIDDRTADRDQAQFQRAELKLAEINRDEVGRLLRAALLNGTMIFRGRPTPAAEAGETVDVAARMVLGKAAQEVFKYYHLAPVAARTNLAYRFLSTDRLDRIAGEQDPLRLVTKSGASTRVDVNTPVLAETLRALRTKTGRAGQRALAGQCDPGLFFEPALRLV